MCRIIISSALFAALILFGATAPAADQPVRRPVTHTPIDLHLNDTDRVNNYEVGIGGLFIPGTATFRPSFGMRLISQYVGLGALVPRFSLNFAFTSRATTGRFSFKDVSAAAITLEALARPPRMKIAPYVGLGLSLVALSSSADEPYFREVGPYDDKTGGSRFALGSDVTWQAAVGITAGKLTKRHAWLEIIYLPAMPRMKLIRTVDGRETSFYEEYEYPKWRLSLGVSTPL